MVANAPSPRDSAPGQSEPARSEVGFSDAYRQAQRQKAIAHRDGRRRDPSPAEIAAMCEEIRRGWSKAEHRIRAGLAPADNNARKAMTRQLESRGYVRGWTPPVCRDFSGGKGVR
ncbi:MAG: hypothetical protein KF777_00170 [Planctomycetaceae bacterium]|nr:hypothetical protein [Planctomycetaceae bacterium]